MATPSSEPVRTTARKLEPRPGELSMTMSPPSMFASRRLMTSPSPVPPKRRVVDVSA